MQTKTEYVSGETDRRGFFSRGDLAAFWTGALISFAVYFLTVAPSVTLEDSGELAVAGDHLGVPHPPGYPIWTICAWIFTKVFGFVTFRGQPNPAWAIAVMSGFFGAIAVGVTAMLIKRTSFDMIKAAFFRNDENERTIPSEETLRKNLPLLRSICFCAGISGALVFAFSPVMWSQCTIVEVYSLNAFFLMFIFLFTYMWMKKPLVKYLWITGFLFGLGFTNYQVLLFAAVPLVIAVILHNTPLFRDFILVGIPFALTMGIMKLGSLQSQPGFPKLTLITKVGAVPAIKSADAVKLAPYYIFTAAFAIILVVSLTYLGILSKRKSASRSADGFKGNNNVVNDKFRHAAYIAAILSAVALISTLGSTPAAKFPVDISRIDPSDIFKWGIPAAVFFAAVAVLFLFAFFVPGGIWYAAAISAILTSLCVLLIKGALFGLTHPLSPFFSLYLLLNFVYLALAWLILPNGRVVSLTIFFTELGVAFYGYMPLSSDTNPPMNWGYPRTWEGFKHAVTRGQYEKIVPVTIPQLLSPVFVKQIADYFTDLRTQFTLLLAPIGFIPFAVWRVRIGKKRFNIFPIAAVLAVLVAASAVLERIIDPETPNNFGALFKIPMAVIIVLAGLGFFMMVIGEGREIMAKAFNRESPEGDRLVNFICFAGLVIFLLICAAGISVIASEYLLDAVWNIPEPQPGADAAAYNSKSIPLALLIFAGLCAFGGLITWLSCRKNRNLEVLLDPVSRKWIITTMAGFLMMSVVLIAMAKPKGDIQDNFIQKVKFIASHGFFAIWVGYGMAYSLAMFIKSRRLCTAGCCAVLLLALVPVHENYFNYDLADTISAAEQNGHDFGWQFGNYQLRGADAVAEELLRDEEPLPNPTFPPEMTKDAVFFGGTDPGRFVPTYMIFSARVRPDVFLITQNALADNTYINTMRDMYGDQIWMPTVADNNAAFEKYVREVQSGRLPNLGGIKMDTSGRIQINGAQEVMEINAIITRDIFDHNCEINDFYVEESYALRWMYPYLTPHGLIMKINRNPTGIASENKTADMDFWDWYTRRLTSNKKFVRDVAARKAFSKLRTSIAGLYTRKFEPRCAERAFMEALLIYPYSPESNIRLIREVFLPQSRIEESAVMLKKFIAKDKNNMSLPPVLETINEMGDAKNLIDSMPAEINTASFTDEDVLKLSRAYATIGDPRKAYEVVSKAVAARRDQLSSEFVCNCCSVLYGLGLRSEVGKLFELIPEADYDDKQKVSDNALSMMTDTFNFLGNRQNVIASLKAILRRNPGNWTAWMEYAKHSYALGNFRETKIAMRQALKIGTRNAEQMVLNTPELLRAYKSLFAPASSVGPIAPISPFSSK